MMSYEYAVDAELALRKRMRNNSGRHSAPSDWQLWCKKLFPQYFKFPFAQRHEELWRWAVSLTKGKPSKTFIALWSRGGAKSTNAEAVVSYLGAEEKKKYVWYVSSTQEKADAHVQNIASMLESSEFSKYYYSMSRRAVNKYGSSKGWRRNRLHCSNGFVVDSLGLDTGARGVKVEEMRPDLIVLDDIDELHDSIATTLKKVKTITQTIMPSGSSDCSVLFIQNLISPDSIASRLLDGRADFMRDRIISGAYPAVDNLAYEQDEQGRFVIVSGDPTWEGQSLEVCQMQMNAWGLSAFLREAQHEVENTGGIWDHITFQHIEYGSLPRFIDGCVWVDPAVTSTDSSDCQGISVGAKSVDKKLVGLYWWEGIDTPRNTIKRAIYKAIEYGITRVGAETDQGGDTWVDVYKNAVTEIRHEFISRIGEEKTSQLIFPKFVSDKAGHGYGSKIERNQRMLTDYENGRVIHMNGTHNMIERALKRFPNEPLDLADSWFWVWNDLLGRGSIRLYSASA